MEKTIEELNNESHKHGQKAMEYFDEARKLQSEAIRETDLVKQRKLIERSHKADRNAIEESRKANSLLRELTKKQRE